MIYASIVALSHDLCIMSGTLALSHESVPLLKHRSPNFITYHFNWKLCGIEGLSGATLQGEVVRTELPISEQYKLDERRLCVL